MKRVLSAMFSAALALGLSPIAAPQVPSAWAADASAPTIDGNLGEWSGVAKQASTDPDITYWQAAKDSDGNVYLAISGTASTQWVDWQWGNNQTSKMIGATINGNARSATAFANLGGSAPRNSWEPPLIGTYKQNNEANGNNAGPMYVEVKIDASSFNGSSDYSLSFAGTTVKASDIPAFAGSSSGGSDTPSDEPTTYKGISIDGDFSDWAAVQKFDTEDPNPEHKQNLAAEAMVFDGDNVYIYVEEGKGGSAAGAGTHGNGQFAITTDLGNTLLVKLNNDNTVTAGNATVSAKHVGKRWEICVPKSALPSYQKTISFGLYQQEPVVKDVANLDTSDSGNSGQKQDIDFDGDYSKWNAYPHTLIQYATAGTQEKVPDGEAALSSHDGKLYSHVKTEMPSHLQERGGEFLNAVTYDFGDGHIFYPRFVEADANGNITNINPSGLSSGDHELCMLDADGWGVNVGQNVNNLPGNALYGKIKVTVGENGGKRDESESVIYLDQIGEKFHIDATDFKEIKAQWGRIGQQWVSTAGTPTGPWLGTAIAVGSVVVVAGGYALYRRRKQDAPATPVASEPVPAN